MKIGLLADIHESVVNLKSALDRLAREGVERIIVLGDIFEAGKSIHETVQLLSNANAEGVWGNHDFGICGEVSVETQSRFHPEVFAYTRRLRPKIRMGEYLFQHVEPWLNPEKIEDLWYFEGPPKTAEQICRGFAADDHRVSFHGHYHRWLVGTAMGILPWQGAEAISLSGPDRYLVVIDAVARGYCATFDTEANLLTPIRVGESEW